MRENVAIREKVADRNPEDRRVRERLAYSLRDLAEVELAMDDRAAAQRDFRRTIGLYEALAALGPLVPQSLNRYAAGNDALGELEWKAGRIDRACPLFLKAASLLDEVPPARPLREKPTQMRRRCGHTPHGALPWANRRLANDVCRPSCIPAAPQNILSMP